MTLLLGFLPSPRLSWYLGIPTYLLYPLAKEIEDGCQDKIVALYLAMRCYPGCNCGNPFLHCGLWTA
ncbi:hypothetical protein HZ326_17666 [Fusarium oxysporum f. sp. albedinis]|nr:hypothetical protein HZ326_17666 [Fusarium oxysporum f. sp. albedinis]